LGVTVALDNEYGCTGLTPEAVAYFFSLVDQDTCSSSPETFETAIVSATANLRPGDVLLIEVGIKDANDKYVPAEVNSNLFQKVQLASNTGIVVVEVAGNANVNLDANGPDDQYLTWRSWGDSGAIVVGAGSSDIQHDRLGFSNHGSRVNVQGWGQNVFSLGYGDFADLAPGDPDRKQTYTNTFNGTSSAASFIAAAAASLQSIRYAQTPPLPPLSPLLMRQLLVATGVPEGTPWHHIGPFPDMAKAILQLGIGAPDCNQNGKPDLCDISSGVSADCNCNSVPDSCDIANATSEDVNQNAVPDECDTGGACCFSSEPHDCIMTATGACCDALNGVFWHGLHSKCETIDCSEGAMRPQLPPEP